ncbi:hypothetical protein NM688_g3227 [Phlebia brevispora]|uniref:Uncharacterized protein n=1 Tax=Phlebia brevispora TaxID=194682 RepID=A0ACC1T711_9APHY|nr:hypothetical protein NM688_g3227 [Phlebia brevispora]
MNEHEHQDALPKVAICQLPEGSTPVHDADEEVFLLYTALAARNSKTEAQAKDGAFRGLGFLDSHQDVLTLEFSVQVVDVPPIGQQDEQTVAEDLSLTSHSRKHGKTKHRHKHKLRPPEEKTITVQVAQDTTSLRSRKGDTGSVLWRACIDFAQMILCQWYAHARNSLFDPVQLAKAHVLELGAGTGLLSVLLSPLVRHYTVTDIEALVHLLAKNLTLNDIPHSTKRTPSNSDENVKHGTVTVDVLDWLTVHGASLAERRRLCTSYAPVDLLLVVDCIYHPSLLPALVGTIDALTIPGRTTVVVVVELRAEDVVREFLELWLHVGEDDANVDNDRRENAGEDQCGKARWEIWHANTDGLMDGPYAVWVGWKKPPDKDFC